MIVRIESAIRETYLGRLLFLITFNSVDFFKIVKI